MLLPCLLSAQIAKNGVADLRSYDFTQQPSIKLDGEWAFYPSEFVSPTSGVQLVQETINLPKRWDESGYPSMGFGTYSLTILRPIDSRLAVRIPDLFSAYQLYVNSELVTQVGTPGIDAQTSRPGRKVEMVSLTHFNSDSLHLVLHISNFTHLKGGIGASIILGDQNKLYAEKSKEDAADLFLSGGLVIGAFFFLSLYFFGQQEKIALYFALFCLAYSYRIVGWGNYVLYDIVDLPYRLGMFFEYSTLYLSGFFFALYIKNLYPDETPKVLTNIFSYTSLVFVFFALLPIHILSRINYYYIYGLLLGLILLCYVLIKALLQRRQGAILTAFSILGIFMIFSVKTLSYLNVIEEIKSITLGGQIIFFFFQAMVLSKHYSESWLASKRKAEEASQAKSDFVSVMSHEIRTPLNAVIGTTHHLIENNQNPEQKADLDNLKHSSENLLSLINNILDFSKIDAGKIELEKSATNLKDFCSQAIEMIKPIADQKGVELILELDEKLPKKVALDKVRLSQVLANLLGNSIKFTEKGHVKLIVNQLTIKGDICRIYFAVEDTGLGISENVKDSIFEAFNQANNSVTRKFGGTGLGLTITKKLVELMKSRIFVESELGKGSVFSFVLSMEVCDNHEEIELKPAAPKDISGHHILLVEDNSMNILIATRLLHKWGLNVIVAQNGKEALDLIATHEFDLVLMDLQMPIMDGYEATFILRQQGYKKPIIALTASPVFDDTSKLKKSDLDGIISKPYIPNDLYNVLVEKLLK
jgi:signal transduction histidine kinase/CheY-like chemotaxis protein